MRRAECKRETKETSIDLSIELDGSGNAEIQTGIGFFDHMLTHIARHGLFDLKVAARGDLEVDDHHTVEDIGICLGKAFAKAIGTAAGITRYGHAVVPMDEAMAETAIDVSGRPFLMFSATFPKSRTGTFDAELVEEFLRAFAMNGKVTLHVMLRHGSNVHHCIEAIFKSLGRAMSAAVKLDPRVKDVPSTKGTLV
jgi:imidazoleglycerol-phosphate dehydratase